MIKKTVILIAIFYAVIACSKDEISEKAAFDIQKYQTEFVNNTITPANEEFVLNSEKLNEAILKFSTNVNEQNLLTLKTAWKNAALSYSKTEVGNFGNIKNTGIHLAIYSWSANEIGIEDFITSTRVISENSINSLPTKTRGLSAIEYLIFEENATETITAFSDQRRLDYLIYLGENLLKKANSLKDQWQTYSPIFIKNTASGLNGSINMTVNQMNVLLENIRRFKIGEPSGLENSTTINTNLLQADKSGISLDIIEKNIESLKATYFGNTYGLDDYVSLISNKDDINTAIKNQFLAIENDISSFANSSLKEVINAKNLKVNNLYQHIKELIVLIKVDVASTLSITVTFTDNDGD
ncbi:imelysin family protein [Polaribacter batillariae]|uniref:Imelysin family protein n=1 Tax=Polaribacter batillariae TaxID=2808900 RepID=A0ABX7SVC9_9FLAO|nr:imelysin family protein [Polaribacter batillariae]QTD38197.1 imelysin family protein [Polaribacter batillariae]